MENGSNQRIQRAERGQNIVEDLHLDRVVASQPEIGPSPPDGGYGWMIVASAMVYNITVPAVLTLYALVILKSIRDEDHEQGEPLKIWDVDIALVPVMLLVVRLLLESWSRAIVKMLNMPRFIALAGLCMTVAGILLSSYSTDAYTNDIIVNIFAGLFAGAGCALTGQQTEVIITIYFREKLTVAQRLVKMAPSIGNCIVPIIIGYLCTIYNSDAVVMVYGAIIMQNCFFLASYTRPIYIERVIRTTYRKIVDPVDDDDEIIFSNQNSPTSQPNQSAATTSQDVDGPNVQDEDATDVVVFKSKTNAKEILDPVVQQQEKSISSERRFSSDFNTMYNDAPGNRFSSDFGTLDITSYSRIGGYRELENIDRTVVNPQPLYRETTVNAPDNTVVFATEISPGTARRTALLKKNFITIKNMLMDINFYLYSLLHLCTTFSVLVLGLLFPVFLWEQNPTMNIWGISKLVSVAHGSALCFILLGVLMPQNINQKARLCTILWLAGAAAFLGISLAKSKSFLVLWSMVASITTAASSILTQPLYNSTLNEFSSTATITFANAIVAIFVMAWALFRNYTYQACFITASILQVVTACIFFVSSFRRRR